MKIHSYLFLLLLMSQTSFAQQTFTLKEAMNYGVKNSTAMRNVALDLVDADYQIRETAAIGLPQVNGQLGLTRYLQVPRSIIDNTSFPGFDQSALPPPYDTAPIDELPGDIRYSEFTTGVKNTLSGQLDLSVILFDRTYITGLKAAKQLKSLVGSQIASTALGIENNIREAYVATLIIDESKNTLNNNISNLQKTLYETNLLYENGFVEKLDIERIELSLANLSVEIDRLEDQRQLLYNILKYQMSYPVADEIIITDNLNTLLLDALEVDTDEDVDVTKRPEFVIFQERYKINEFNLERIKSGYYPSLVGFGSYGLSLSRDRLFKDKDIGLLPASLVGLQLNVPIFDSFSKRNQYERAKITIEKIKNEEVELRRALNLQVQNAKLQYKTALKDIASTKKNLALANKIYDTTKIKYKEGLGSSLELTQGERDVYQAQANYNRAIYDLVVAKAALDNAVGMMTD